jgi:hypothetical protein
MHLRYVYPLAQQILIRESREALCLWAKVPRYMLGGGSYNDSNDFHLHEQQPQKQKQNRIGNNDSSQYESEHSSSSSSSNSLNIIEQDPNLRSLINFRHSQNDKNGGTNVQTTETTTSSSTNTHPDQLLAPYELLAFSQHKHFRLGGIPLDRARHKLARRVDKVIQHYIAQAQYSQSIYELHKTTQQYNQTRQSYPTHNLYSKRGDYSRLAQRSALNAYFHHKQVKFDKYEDFVYIHTHKYGDCVKGGVKPQTGPLKNNRNKNIKYGIVPFTLAKLSNNLFTDPTTIGQTAQQHQDEDQDEDEDEKDVLESDESECECSDISGCTNGCRGYCGKPFIPDWEKEGLY